MTPTSVVELGRQALMKVTLLVSAPLFIAALVTRPGDQHFPGGDADRINETTLSFDAEAGGDLPYAGRRRPLSMLIGC